LRGSEGAGWTVREVLDWTLGRFSRAGLPSPRLDAELLLARAVGCARIDLYTDPQRPLTESERATYRALVAARLEGRPVAHLLGRREFWSMDLAVDARVLVPRPDTETLVEEALDLLRGHPAPWVVDVGTGSGAVGLALARERPDARVVFLDRSREALAVASENARALGRPFRAVAADLLSATIPGALDLVVSNPPYLRPDEIVGDLRWEPRGALDGGPDGLGVTLRLIDEAADRLKPGGALAIEIASPTATALLDRLSGRGWTDARVRHDLVRAPRVVSARRR
jgi:release factor glutamine methyltransferase